MTASPDQIAFLQSANDRINRTAGSMRRNPARYGNAATTPSPRRSCSARNPGPSTTCSWFCAGSNRSRRRATPMVRRCASIMRCSAAGPGAISTSSITAPQRSICGRHRPTHIFGRTSKSQGRRISGIISQTARKSRIREFLIQRSLRCPASRRSSEAAV